MIHNYFVFDSISSLDCGAYIFPREIDSAPKRSIEKIEVPGRNGSLIIDNNRYEDGKQGYTGVIYDDGKFDEYIQMLRAVVLNEAGYKRLEDTFKPDEYRMAYFDGDFSPKVVRLWKKMGKFELNFTCKPQRYLKIGEKTNEFTGAGILYNPSLYPAQPMLRAFGWGQINIGAYGIYIAENQLPYVDIDCERMDAYYNNINCNNMISLSSDFPVLGREETEISFDRTITMLQIVPRWWLL